MATYEYYEIVGDLMSNRVIPKSEIYDFEISPRSEVYRKYFQFCQENLTERCQDYNIQPAKFFSRENFEVNARAGLFNNYFVIAVNKGTIDTLYEFFYNQNYIFEEENLLNFRKLNTILDVPVEYIMYQSAILFTYYHELGHLIQKSPDLSLWINEQYINNQNKFNPLNHIYEFDADMHAANTVCFHPIDLWRKLSGDNKNKSNLEKLLSLTLSGIFSYFMFLMKNRNEEIYYDKSTHPHPLIRITYILTAFVGVAQEYYVDISQEKIVNEAFEITKLLFKKIGTEDVIDEYKKTLLVEYKNILGYITALAELSKSVPNLAINTVHKKGK